MRRKLPKVHLQSIVKRVRMRTWVALGILCLLLPITLIALFKPSTPEAAWANDSWGYRQKVTFGYGSNTTNLKIKLDVNTSTLISAGKLQSDCDDMRFTDINGLLLRYYLDSAGGACNTTSTDFYVLIPVINNSTVNVFYMYYGNPTAIRGSEAANFAEATLTPTSGPSFSSEEKGQSPVAYWSFDQGADNTCTSGGSTDTCDSSQNANHGSLNGPTWVSEDRCVSGKCLQFDGSNDYVDMGTGANASFTFGTAATYSAWIYPTALTNNAVIFNKWQNNNEDKSFYLDDTGKINGFFFNIGTGITSNGTVALNTWSYVVITYDGSAYRLYINGKLDHTVNASGDVADASTSLYVGDHPTRGQSETAFKGRMDEMKVYNYALTSAQIATEYGNKVINDGIANTWGAPSQKFLGDGLVGYWKTDETSGPAVDFSGNGNNGTWTGNATSAAGKFGNSISLDGTGDYLSVADSSSLDITGPITLSAWINISSSGAWDTILGKTDATTAEANYAIRTSTPSTDELDFYYAIGGNWHIYSTSNADLTTSTWYHIVLTYDGTTTTFYRNGQQLTGSCTFGTCTGTLQADTNILGIGRGGEVTTQDFPGKIDEIRVYKRAFSPTEVQALYNWAPGPVGYWNFDENTGTTIYDTSGNGYTGTTTGSPPYVPGKYGSAMSFNGSNYATMATGVLGATRSGTGTVMFWINGNTFHEGNAIYEEHGGFNNFAAAWPSTSGDTFDFNVGSNTARSTIKNNFQINTWYHMAISWDGTNIRIYVNGVLDNTISSNASLSTANNNTSFGRHNYSGGGAYFNGKLDEVKFYNYTRTPAQIIEDMNGGHPLGGSPVGSQIAQWKMDERDGTTLNNTVSTNSTLTGSISGATWTTGCKYNSCLSFDGTDDVTTVTNANAIDLNVGLSTGFTWSAWIYPDTAGEGTGGQIFYKGTNTWMRVDTLGSGVLDLEASLDLATADATINATDVVTAGQWNHVAMSWTDDSDDEVTLWVNGKPVATSTNGNGAPAADTGNFLIGGTTTNNFDGYIDHAEIYGTELVASDMAIVMNANAAINFATGSDEGSIFTETESIPASAAGHWKLDEGVDNTCSGGSNDACDSVGSNDMSNLSATWTSAGSCVDGGCLQFNGSSNYLNRSNVITATQTNWTLSAWVNPSSLSQSGMFAYNGTDANGYGFGISNGSGSNGAVLTGLYGSVTWINSGYTFPSTAQWYHVAMVRDSSTVRFYVNGVQTANTSSSTPGVPTNRFTIGNMFNSANTTPLRYFNGYIDDVKVYTTALSAIQIANEANVGIGSSSMPAPFEYFDFDEGSGTTAIDKSGNNRDATITNATYRVGKINTALRFDGSGDYVTLQSTTATDETHTYMAWIYPESANGGLFQQDWSGCSPDACGTAFYLQTQLKHKRPEDGPATTPPITLNRWHHVAVTIANRRQIIYINGAIAGRKDSPISVNAAGTKTRYVGNAFNQYPVSVASFTGLIDEVKIFDEELTPTQIAYEFNRGAPLAHWKFDECTGSTAYNSTGYSDNSNSNYHMTITVGGSGGNTAAGSCGSSGAWNNGISGKYNSSFDFDGTDDYADAGNLVAIGGNSDYPIVYGTSNDYTITGWFNRDSFTTDDTIFAKRNGVTAADKGQIIYVDDSTDKLVFEQSDGTDEFQMESSSTFTSSGWNHFAVIMDRVNGAQRLFINGREETPTKTGSATSINGINNTVNVRIGSESDGGNPFDGKLDEIKYFNYPFTYALARRDYNQGSAARYGPSSGLP